MAKANKVYKLAHFCSTHLFLIVFYADNSLQHFTKSQRCFVIDGFNCANLPSRKKCCRNNSQSPASEPYAHRCHCEGDPFCRELNIEKLWFEILLVL